MTLLLTFCYIIVTFLLLSEHYLFSTSLILPKGRTPCQDEQD